jgi:hypothetical protein
MSSETKKPWENDNCDAVKSYFGYYTVPQAALLWCGVPADRVDTELSLAVPVGDNNSLVRAVLKHPYIPCLEPRCRAIHDAIDNDQLQAGRDGGKVFLKSEAGHIAYDRRTLNRESLKEWIAKTFPNDKPTFLFDDIERATHTAINADSYRALQADRDALKSRIDKATEVYKALKQDSDSLKNERDSLQKIVEDLTTKLQAAGIPNERSETTYQNIIAALLDCISGNLPGVVKHPSFDSEAKLIESIDQHFRGYAGLSKSNLSRKFPEAKRNLKNQ